MSINRGALALVLMMIASTSFAQTAARAQFTTALDTFVDVCVETAPKFRKTKSVARKFGITELIFLPEIVGTNKYGMYHGANFHFEKSHRGTPVPTEPGQIALSFAKKLRSVDAHCGVTISIALSSSAKKQVRRDMFARLQALMEGHKSRQLGDYPTAPIMYSTPKADLIFNLITIGRNVTLQMTVFHT